MSRIHFALSCVEGTTERKSTIGVAKEPDIGWSCDYTDAKAKRLETELPLYYPNAHADTTARRSAHTYFERSRIMASQMCHTCIARKEGKPVMGPIQTVSANKIPPIIPIQFRTAGNLFVFSAVMLHNTIAHPVP